MKKSEFFAEARDDLTGPLAGVRVLEATTTWAGPMAGCVLADYGADVIKIEHPAGEVIRRLPPLIPDSTHTIPDETVNRNKRNFTLELRTDAGRELFLKLCLTADIIIENFRPGTLDSWGIGYADVKKLKADIVYVSISGFGQFGELSDRVGYDPMAQSFCGFTSLNGAPDGQPTKAPTYLGDDLSGLHGALGAMAALRHRDQTGEGQHVDVALVDSILSASDGFPTAGALGLPLPRRGNQFGISAPVNRYPCEDGDVYAGVLLDSHWRLLTKLVGRDDLAGLSLTERLERRDEVDKMLADWCIGRSVAQVVSTFAELGLPATRMNTYADIAHDSHVASRDMLQMVQLADGKEIPITAPAAKFSRTPVRIRHAAPTLGEHNEEILDELGYSREAQQQLAAEGTTAIVPPVSG